MAAHFLITTLLQDECYLWDCQVFQLICFLKRAIWKAWFFPTIGQWLSILFQFHPLNILLKLLVFHIFPLNFFPIKRNQTNQTFLSFWLDGYQFWNERSFTWKFKKPTLHKFVLTGLKVKLLSMQWEGRESWWQVQRCGKGLDLFRWPFQLWVGHGRRATSWRRQQNRHSLRQTLLGLRKSWWILLSIPP